MAKDLNNSRFTFIGEIVTGKEPMVTQKMGDKGWQKTKLNIGVKVDQNTQFLTLEYMHHPDFKTIKLLGEEDFKMFEVKNPEDTLKEEIINKTANFTRTIIDLETDFDKKNEYIKLIYKIRNHEMADPQTEDDIAKIKEYTAQVKELATKRKTFCHAKDVIPFVNSVLGELKGKKVKVTGSVKSNFYNGENRLQYVPSTIEIVNDDVSPMLRAYMDIFFDKDSIDEDKKEKKIFVGGYIGEKIKNKETKVKELKLFPINVLIDYTKLNLEDEKQVALLDFLKMTFEIKNKKEVHRMGVEIAVVNGREQVEFDESQLTPLQRQQVQLGLASLDSFRPRGGSYGEPVQELKVFKADFKNFPEGSVEMFPVKELADYLATNDGDVTKDKIKDTKKDNEPVKKDEEEEKTDMMAALFS